MDTQITELTDVPYTISYVMRKRMQIDSLNELPSDKRPPELMIWDGKPEDIDKWIKQAFDRKSTPIANLVISESEIEM